MTNPLKSTFLDQFRLALKVILASQLQGKYENMNTLDLKELSKSYIESPLTKIALKSFGIEAEDIEKLLTECRDELLEEAKSV